MTGIEKILDHIKSDTESEVSKIISGAEKEAAEIIEKAKAQVDKKSKLLEEQMKEAVENQIKRGKSTASLKEKRIILEAKQQIITDVIENTKQSLYKLSDKEYFEVISKMVKKYSTGQKGQIMFSPEDKKRMPKDFDKTIQSASLTISEETRPIDGGFVLAYGDIEENCSFEALFSVAKDTLQDKVGSLLFE